MKYCPNKCQSWAIRSLVENLNSENGDDNDDESLEYINQSLFINRDHSFGYIIKASILNNLKKSNDAITCYWISYSLTNDIFDLERIVNCYIQLKQYDEAKAITDEIEKIIQSSPLLTLQQDPDNYCYSHLLYLKGKIMINNCEEAKQMFEKCLEMDNENILAMIELAKIYMKCGNYTEALKLFKIICNKKPSEEVMLQYAKCLSECEEKDKAILIYHKILKYIYSLMY